VLRILITRAILAALPFAVYFIWRDYARRMGREMGSTPWGWLTGAGALLVALSLFATVLFRPATDARDYRPAEAHPGGAVTPGGFK
jgi:hypothetical protein